MNELTYVLDAEPAMPMSGWVALILSLLITVGWVVYFYR
ncbi:hypothetical protein C483_15946 [Natrialba hulunbeirensis JCM 10989]|uniref:Uncharacterized protein n=2 Tax=Natrialba TaxID=63742 RepID=M0AA96_9EURY|nr:hypothetical protein C483_15946 [Natrialba hulunbeirensis JCM 10989]ELY94812.1 hypothetical protein C482_17093 [Natrialba chahannaoensis JCM 10990]